MSLESKNLKTVSKLCNSNLSHMGLVFVCKKETNHEGPHYVTVEWNIGDNEK